MENVSQPAKQRTEEEKLRAAYALNMCTVSVSQIIDYNDSYILDQEYDAILNNLNLQKMPPDDALLRILTEILNTITFFKIQDIKKKQIDKKYQMRIKNAIWSAIPSPSTLLSVNVTSSTALSGMKALPPLNVAATALSIATTIGTAYMNYRKEKAAAADEREDKEIELQITAIEQFDALKRELFTTAWRLANEYDFDDKLRLTEKQISQYNTILMDRDEHRKYARLESVADKFQAYPPFWYFYGHTANYIAETSDDKTVQEMYREKAQNHFDWYFGLCEDSILREDQLVASAALEYVDLLLHKESKNVEKICKLVKLAEQNAPNSWDILQLCAIAYQKIECAEEAIRLLKILVNEDYNRVANARVLSLLYVKKYLSEKDEKGKALCKAEYGFLSACNSDVLLFPLPEGKSTGEELEMHYLDARRDELKKAFDDLLHSFKRICYFKYVRLFPPFDDPDGNDYAEIEIDRKEDAVKAAYGHNKEQDLLLALKGSSFRMRYSELINDMVQSLDAISLFHDAAESYRWINQLRSDIVARRSILTKLVDKVDTCSLTQDEYIKLMTGEYSFINLTARFFLCIKTGFQEQLDAMEEIEKLEKCESDLMEFCATNSLPNPFGTANIETNMASNVNYFSSMMWGKSINNEQAEQDRKNSMLDIIKKEASSVILNKSKNSRLLISGEKEFDRYFKNRKLDNTWKGMTIPTILAIIDDISRKDRDLLLSLDGVLVVRKNKVYPTIPYDKIKFSAAGDKAVLEFNNFETYSNSEVNISALNDLIQELGDKRKAK